MMSVASYDKSKVSILGDEFLFADSLVYATEMVQRREPSLEDFNYGVSPFCRSVP